MDGSEQNPTTLTSEERELFDQLASSIDDRGSELRRVMERTWRRLVPVPGQGSTAWRAVMLVAVLVCVVGIVPVLGAGLVPAFLVGVVAGALSYLVLRDLEMRA